MALWRFIQSTVGQKIVMGATGILLFGFVLVHMLGNLQIFIGPDALNNYAKLLKSEPLLLWIFRLGLLGITILHVMAAITLTRRNRAAKPKGYASGKIVEASVASRTMAISGTIVLAFIIFHLLHFTTHTIFPDYSGYYDSESRHDVYRMVVEGFQIPWIAAGYIICVGLLCLHLSHGLQAMFRSLGLSNPAHAVWQVWFARVFATVIFLGMAAVPAAVWLHLVDI